MNTFLRQMDIPFTVVATKADKISRGARLKYIAPICRALAVQPWQIIPFSAEGGTGREELLARIEKVTSAFDKCAARGGRKSLSAAMRQTPKSSPKDAEIERLFLSAFLLEKRTKTACQGLKKTALFGILI